MHTVRTQQVGKLKKICPFKLFCLASFLLLSVLSKSQTCNNWVSLPSQPSYIRVGDLDVTGNKITVEALINRTAPWNGIDLFQGDVVSKHEDPKDCNYLLRPSSAEITTTNGYYKTPTICPIQLNKTYHVAMVYDGTALKFYRNGFLMSQIAASGNMVLNDWQTQIGLYYNQTTQENFIGYINEVRIWNIARTQEEIKSFMSGSLPSPQSTPGLLAYYTFDNLLNKQGNTAWNGKLGGSASINKTNPNCKLVVDSCNIKPCDKPLLPDFSFSQDVCNPKNVQFVSNIKDIKLYEWEFGNGQTSSGNASPSVKYADFNVYNVKLRVQNEEGCKDSITKRLMVNVQQAYVIATSDTTICMGDSVILRTVNEGLEFCWLPASGLDNSKVRQPTAKPVTTTTYSFTSKTIGNNLVINGDFSNGNKDFQSDYIFANSGLPAGVYNVGNNIKAWHSGMISCTDHTTATGNMMMVNGADKRGAKVWTQTIAIRPNTNYVFSTWLQTITTINPAQLQFVINGQTIGGVINASSESCLWRQFYTTWNSGANTSATITIINLNELLDGNDFALDDIFFGEVLLKQETVKVNVSPRPLVNVGSDISICKDATVQLKAEVNQSDNVKWIPALYLDDPNSKKPITKPLQTTTYIAEAINNEGCTQKDTITVSVVEKPIIEYISELETCLGTPVILNPKVQNATTYSWQPSAGLSKDNIINPTATPLATTQYTFTATNEGCSESSKISVIVKSLPEVKVTNDTTVCEASHVQLKAEGGMRFSWTPSNSLSNHSISDPIATPSQTTLYYVSTTGSNGCTGIDSVKVMVKPKPVFGVTPLSSSLCIGDTVTLTASGGDIYKWSPASTLLTTETESVRAIPKETTTYKVYIKDFVCEMEDSISTIVAVNPLPVSSVTKSGDVDCSNTNIQLLAKGGVGVEWFPSSGLSNTSIPNPIASPRQTTTYTVTIRSQEGCLVKDSVTVNVSNTGDKGFYVPSAFTPNYDGKNDCFRVKYLGSIDDYSIHIYNRWGEQVFYSRDISACWDGSYKGLKQPKGVYVYYIKAKTFCGEIFKKGTLVLVQ